MILNVLGQSPPPSERFQLFFGAGFFCQHIEDILTFIERYLILSKDTSNLSHVIMDPLVFGTG